MALSQLAFRHHLAKPLSLLLALALLAPAGADAQTRDVAGSRDFAGIGRFAGSVIIGPSGEGFRRRADAGRTVQGRQAGRCTAAGRQGHPDRLSHNPGPSILEVSRNFETQLTKAGFETLLNCDTDACGGIPFTEAIDALPIPQMWVDGFNYHYFAGRKTEGGREIYASVSSARTTAISMRSSRSPNSARSRTRWWMPPRCRRASARAGRIALYGIYFDTDKAVMRPESRPPSSRSRSCCPPRCRSMSSSSATPTARGLCLQSRSVATARRGDR